MRLENSIHNYFSTFILSENSSSHDTNIKHPHLQRDKSSIGNIILYNFRRSKRGTSRLFYILFFVRKYYDLNINNALPILSEEANINWKTIFIGNEKISNDADDAAS